MIITHVLGGLGNQMFQYAAGYALAKKNNTSLKLDLSDFQNYQLHQGYELDNVFGINMLTATSEDVKETIGWFLHFKNVRRIVRRIIFFHALFKNLIFEPHFHLWSKFKTINHKAYLQGYWQSEKYFSDYSTHIREKFQFKPILNADTLDLIEEIKKHNSISIHIRRGDYVTDKKNHSVMAICSIKYYEAAIEYFLNSSINNVVFYVFSDDIDWAKNNLRIERQHYFVEHNKGNSNYIDMQLMSNCKHHIISNSTFSWWGAWLNASDQKIVIAPKLWFVNGFNDNDLIPAEWIRL
jgi:Glycosyl transferase family 11